MENVEFRSIQRKIGIDNKQTAEILGLKIVTVRGYTIESKIPPIVDRFMRFLLSAHRASGHIGVAGDKVRELWTN